MYHEADAMFWDAALKNFPALPHLTEVQIIYHYRTSKALNTSCWDRLDSILSNRDMFPRLKAVDICPTFRSQRLGHRKLSSLLTALWSLGQLDRLRLTYWGEMCEIVFVPLNVLVLIFFLLLKYRLAHLTIVRLVN